MKTRLFHRALLLGLGLSVTAVAQEAEQVRAKRPRLGMAPGSPQHRSVAPTLPFGVEPTRADDWVLDFHGFLLMPMNIGITARDPKNDEQSSLVLHSPPQTPQDLREFEWTGVTPTPWIQLNFSYGSTLARGTTILAARSAQAGVQFFNPPDQIGLTDAFLTFDLTQPLGEVVEVNVGAFTNRYGVMGEYDAGRYGTPLIARTNLIGETISAAFEFGDVGVMVEQGFGGALSTPLGLTPAGWNDFADTQVAATLVNHLHAGASYKDFVQVGLHYLSAFSSDDRLAGGLLPDGSIQVIGADARVTAHQFGHLYLGVSHVDLETAGSVSGAIEILNARGGPELIRNYLGPNSNGNGSLLTVGGQYDISVGRLLFPELEGHGPDIFVSLFGMQTRITSDDPNVTGATKLKFGAESTYSAFSWFGFGARFDSVMPDVDLPSSAQTRNFTIVSPRVIFHTDWNSQDQLMLQYSRYIYGDTVTVKTGFPPLPDPRANPDENVLTLSAMVWW